MSRPDAVSPAQRQRQQREPEAPVMNKPKELVERLTLPGGVLYRTDLERLGFERRAVDAIFRELPVIVLPGYSRPMIRTSDYVALLERSTYADDKVRGRSG